MIGFDAPFMLWGLMGLIVPILIHLWSKRDQKVIMVGSVDLFEESETIRSRRLKPNEFLLLTLRCLLIILLVGWLAGVHWQNNPKPSPIAYVVDPALKDHPYVADSVLPLEQGAWLAAGYPPLSEDAPRDTALNHWKAAALFPSGEYDSVVIISSARNGNFREIRPKLPSNTTWITLDASEASTKSMLQFATNTTPQKVTIHVREGQRDSRQIQQLQSVLNRLDNALDNLEIEYTTNPELLGLWHSEQQPPRDIKHWIWIRDLPGDVEIHNNDIWIPEGMGEREIIESEVIFNLLNNIRLNTNNSSENIDNRTLYSILSSPGFMDATPSTNTKKQSPWVWLILLGVILLAERYLSYQKQL